mmetsp:Transcript_22597/g.55805  ORF Transcript_22597/g.55805 Transcript_22597/m.55805 type:complete len:1024 (-) Transcript_22597:142-3213(-)|eukprot:CAMPEP_0197581038 /NCGR_PEP_ID=MMETSP1326-20131121/4677_1 /TAXON_ID=1155430 /ORGANISM="Genus nov. species nov., Strain RCC2288" /LENGTH=1023 /DNA_ID=CAMNT_0043144885 /DNA_START=131 /DNA_END=3202 /DNA_ORIENTATION=+
MAVHRGEEGVGTAGGGGDEYRLGSTIAAVISSGSSRRSGSLIKRGIDVEVANLEKRLCAVFELLRCFTPPRGHGGAEVLEEEVRIVVSSAVKDAMEAARGGLHDAQALVLGALFFAWVKDMPSVAVPCEPFLVHSKWKLSTDLFVSLVKDAGLEGDLRRQLKNIPEHASRKLAVELDGVFPGISDGEAHSSVSEKSGLLQHGVPNLSRGDVGDRLKSAPPLDAAPPHTFRGEAWSQCKLSVSRWRRLNGISSSSTDVSDVASAVESVRRAVHECALGDRLTGSMLLCSSRFHASRSAMRVMDKSRRTAAERELIAILNRLTGGDSWPPGANEQRHANTSSSVAAEDTNNRGLAAELLSPLLMAPQMTFSRLVHIAAKHSPQAPCLLSAFSTQPCVARLQLAPLEPPLILTALARVLRKPPSELRGLNQLAGINNFTVALLQQKQSVLPTRGGESAAREAQGGGVVFGQSLAIPRRSHLDTREALLVTVLPALSTASFWQTNFGNEKDVGSGEGQFRALEILRSLFIGESANAADAADATANGSTGLEVDPRLSPSGVKLLKATFPGGSLLALASYVDSMRADKIGLFPPACGSSAVGSNPEASEASSSRAAPKRTRDLATRLLRSCVKALDRSLFSGRHVSTTVVKGWASILASLAAADAAAATQLSWHTRLLLEPVMGKARKLHTHPLRTAPAAPSPEGKGFGWVVVKATTTLRDDDTGDVARVAVAFADIIRLCSIRTLRASDVMDHIRGRKQQQKHAAAVPGGGDGDEGLERPLGTEAVLDGIATAIRENAESPSTIRSGLLMACVMTLPTCTMKEFGIVLREILPQVVLLISRGGSYEEETKSRGGGGGITPSSTTISIAQFVVDLLTRVFLMHVASVTRREPKHNHINILARQLATAAVVTDNQRLSVSTASVVEAGRHKSTSTSTAPPLEKEKETSYVLVAAGVFHSLKCVSAALLPVVALPDDFRTSSARSKAILSAAVLKLVGALSGLGLQLEVLKLFENFPEGNVKSQVMAACP